MTLPTKILRLCKISVIGLKAFTRDPIGFLRRLPKNAFRLAVDPDFINTKISSQTIDYQTWISSNELTGRRAAAHYQEVIRSFRGRILPSVIMPVYNPDIRLLDDAIQSVVDQYYEDWELCLVDDASDDPEVRARLLHWASVDERIKVSRREENGHICRATNDAFSLSSGNWIGLLDQDDVLAPNALAETLMAVASNPEAKIIYSDEDKIDADGVRRFAPHFKPDYSPELLRSQNYINHFSVFRRDIIEAVGGWRPGYEGSQDHDILLRSSEICDPGHILHIPKILYHWRAVDGSTASKIDNKGYAVDAGLRAVQDHIKRIGMNAVVELENGLPFYRVKPQLLDPLPLVSVIIPTRDQVELLSNCVDGVLGKTDYPHIELIVVDNNSSQKKTQNYLEALSSDSRVKTIFDGSEFNYAALNNKAVRQASGEIIVLLNNDIEVIEKNWLHEMVAWAMQPGVGCVGAKLLYQNGLVQHGGVVLGIGGVAGHAHKRFHRSDNGYFARLKLIQNYSAVTGACLAVKKSIFQEVGGLDDQHLKVAFNDVDFCLKVKLAGYRNVWTPHAELYHLESMSRGRDEAPEKRQRFDSEVRFMQVKWGEMLSSDPYYSPNLTLVQEDFSLRGHS